MKSKAVWLYMCFLGVVLVLGQWGEEVWVLVREPSLARTVDGVPYYRFSSNQEAIDACYSMGQRRRIVIDDTRFCCTVRADNLTARSDNSPCDLPKP